MDNERTVGNEKRPRLKRAKISCFMAAKFKVHGKAANQPRIANDPLKCLHWQTLQSLSRYLPTFHLQGHIFKVKGQIGENYKNFEKLQEGFGNVYIISIFSVMSST